MEEKWQGGGNWHCQKLGGAADGALEGYGHKKPKIFAQTDPVQRIVHRLRRGIAEHDPLIIKIKINPTVKQLNRT